MEVVMALSIRVPERVANALREEQDTQAMLRGVRPSINQLVVEAIVRAYCAIPALEIND